MDQSIIPRRFASLSDTFTLKENPTLYHLLKNQPGSLIISIDRDHRLAIIVLEILKYVKKYRLLHFPTSVQCNPELRFALGVRSFQLSQIADVVYLSTRQTVSPSFNQQEESALQALEKATIIKFILEISSQDGGLYGIF